MVEVDEQAVTRAVDVREQAVVVVSRLRVALEPQLGAGGQEDSA
jgi:hypothetical protein